jgi:uncharacterized protein (DUF111 family)
MPDERVETLVLLETNIDDMPAEWLSPVLEQLLQAGALDAWFTPIQMKKNRPAILLSALCPPDRAPALRALLFAHTSTLGVRQHQVTRYSLPRRMVSVETPYGPVRVKLAAYAAGQWKAAPEFEDCLTASREHQVPLATVYRAAMREAEALLEQLPPEEGG